MWGFFFFQAEDGIRDADVTGVQTCALPICRPAASEDGVEQATVEAVRVTFLRQVPVRDDGQIGLRTHLPTGHRREPYVEVAGEEQLLFQGRTKRGDSEQLQWQPEPQPAEWPRQLDRQVGRRQSVDA